MADQPALMAVAPEAVVQRRLVAALEEDLGALAVWGFAQPLQEIEFFMPVEAVVVAHLERLLFMVAPQAPVVEGLVVMGRARTDLMRLLAPVAVAVEAAVLPQPIILAATAVPAS